MSSRRASSSSLYPPLVAGASRSASQHENREQPCKLGCAHMPTHLLLGVSKGETRGDVAVRRKDEEPESDEISNAMRGKATMA
jgi:hypothetical protein